MIPCAFEYKEDFPDYPYKELAQIDLTNAPNLSNQTIPLRGTFSCENDDERYLLNPEAIEDDSHDYEELESSCDVRRRTLQPKALNNVYNKLIKVVNTDTFVQTINTEECL
jgi:hypothetical protein